MADERMSTEALLSALAMRKASSAANSDDEIYVSSIKDANVLLQMHRAPHDAPFRKKLVAYITDISNRVLSECDVCHNFIMDLFRIGEYDLALKVCVFALSMAPYNRDILGDAIKACGDSSQFDLGEKYLKRAMDIPKDRWSFRMFLYGVDFLKTKLDAYPIDNALFERALALAREYIHYFPYDEHGYNQEAELLLSMNRRDEAIDALHNYIFDIHPNPQSRQSELVTAQCCITLLNILDDSNDYKFIIRICDRGLRNTTQEQPSATIGYFLYRKALAQDALVHNQETINEVSVLDTLATYQAAYDLVQNHNYGRTIEQRYAVLRPHIKDTTKFHPLVKRSLFVEETAASRGAS